MSLRKKQWSRISFELKQLSDRDARQVDQAVDDHKVAEVVARGCPPHPSEIQMMGSSLNQ